MGNDGYYWHPYRPALRVPLRLLAFLILIGAIFVGPENADIRWGSLLFGVAILLWSLRTPRRRPLPFSSPVGKVISRLLIFASVVTVLTYFVYFTLIAP